jgi:hypothetical protein
MKDKIKFDTVNFVERQDQIRLCLEANVYADNSKVGQWNIDMSNYPRATFDQDLASGTQNMPRGDPIHYSDGIPVLNSWWITLFLSWLCGDLKYQQLTVEVIEPNGQCKKIKKYVEATKTNAYLEKLKASGWGGYKPTQVEDQTTWFGNRDIRIVMNSSFELDPDKVANQFADALGLQNDKVENERVLDKERYRPKITTRPGSL